MKIHASSPARAAWAATALARLPVEAHPIVFTPRAAAALIAVATTRSLNDNDGLETASFLIQSRWMPSRLASLGASTRGVNPTSSERVGSPTRGKNSRYRQSECGRDSICWRVGTSVRDL